MAENVESAQGPDTPEAIALQPQRGLDIGEAQTPEDKATSTPTTKQSKQLTCWCCTKVTIRIIKFAISLWQVADMVSDMLNTLKYLHFAEVNMTFIILDNLDKTVNMLVLSIGHTQMQRILFLVIKQH